LVGERLRDGLLTVNLAPAQRACVMGFPVRLTELTVSVDDPSALASALEGDLTLESVVSANHRAAILA